MTATAEAVWFLVAGHAAAALVLALVALMLAAAACLQAVRIRRCRNRAMSRPDYTSIAAMEREIYGETLKHEGAPTIDRIQAGEEPPP